MCKSLALEEEKGIFFLVVFKIIPYTTLEKMIFFNVLRGVDMEVTCPNCGSSAFKRNGYTRHGKQNHRCLECGRQFSLEVESFNFSETKHQKKKNENNQEICNIVVN